MGKARDTGRLTPSRARCTHRPRAGFRVTRTLRRTFQSQMSYHDADYDLIERYARTAGADELTQLVGRYLTLVHSAARRQLGGDAHRAADVTQQVFIVLMRKAKTIRPGTVVASWLLNVT